MPREDTSVLCGGEVGLGEGTGGGPTHSLRAGRKRACRPHMESLNARGRGGLYPEAARTPWQSELGGAGFAGRQERREPSGLGDQRTGSLGPFSLLPPHPATLPRAPVPMSQEHHKLGVVVTASLLPAVPR